MASCPGVSRPVRWVTFSPGSRYFRVASCERLCVHDIRHPPHTGLGGIGRVFVHDGQELRLPLPCR